MRREDLFLLSLKGWNILQNARRKKKGKSGMKMITEIEFNAYSPRIS